MGDQYEGVAWTEEERGLMFALVGEFPPSGIPELGFESMSSFDEMSQKLTELETDLQDMVAEVAETFPEEAAEQFKAGVALLTGAAGAGASAFNSYRSTLRNMSSGRLTQSQQLQKAIWEIFVELGTMIAEIAIATALAPFTGGASLFQATMARIRGAFNILMALHRLLSYIPAGPGLLEMIQEMLQDLGTQLLQLTINPPEWRPDGIDGKSLWVSALQGLGAGSFIQLFNKIG
ncbi:hypothetical protein AN220_13420, partial [Streptomyces nanshensis]